jgi:hypothetical protein
MLDSVETQLEWLQDLLPKVRGLQVAYLFGGYGAEQPEDIDVIFFTTENPKLRYDTGYDIYSDLAGILKAAKSESDFIPFDFGIFSLAELHPLNQVTFPYSFVQYLKNASQTVGQIICANGIAEAEFKQRIDLLYDERRTNFQRQLQTTNAARGLDVRKMYLHSLRGNGELNFSRLFFQNAVRTVLEESIGPKDETQIIDRFVDRVVLNNRGMVEDIKQSIKEGSIGLYKTQVESCAQHLNEHLALD